jgi:hypothetical protein
MNQTVPVVAQADAVRSRRIAIILGVVAAAFYLGTFLFWTPAA